MVIFKKNIFIHYFLLEGTPIPRDLRPVAGELAKKMVFDDNVQGILISKFSSS